MKDQRRHVLLAERKHHRLLGFAVALIFAMAVSSSGSLHVTSAETNPKAQSRWTKLDSAKIHYVNYGKGDEALVLVHGWTQNVDGWRDQAPDFARRNRVIVIDLPGHGQ